MHFSTQAQKLKEIHPEKIYYTSPKTRETILGFPQKKAFLVFRETKPQNRNSKEALNIPVNNLQILEKQTKKSILKKFIVFYDVCAIFTSVEHMKVLFEVKI